MIMRSFIKLIEMMWNSYILDMLEIDIDQIWDESRGLDQILIRSSFHFSHVSVYGGIEMHGGKCNVRKYGASRTMCPGRFQGLYFLTTG